MSSSSPCFLKKPAFCPSSEKEFSQVPASPAAMRNLSWATAAQCETTTKASATVASPRLRLDMALLHCWHEPLQIGFSKHIIRFLPLKPVVESQPHARSRVPVRFDPPSACMPHAAHA